MDARPARNAAVTRRVVVAALAVLLPSAPLAAQVVASGGAHPLASPPLFADEARAGAAVRFVARTAGLQVRAERGAVTFVVFDESRGLGHVVRLGLDPALEPVGTGSTGARVHVLQGDDPAAWRRDVPAFTSVTFVDDAGRAALAVEGAPGGLRFSRSRGADPLALAIDGADDTTVDGDGALHLRTPVGDVVIGAAHGRTSPGDATGPVGRWILRDGGAALDEPDLPADVFDTTWSTYFGGNLSGEGVRGVDVDVDGTVVVCGWTLSSDFPVTPGALKPTLTSPGFFTGFVSRITADGSALLTSTYLGGNDYDVVNRVVVHAGGEFVLAGETSSMNFPVTPGAFDAIDDVGGRDAFVARLTADGSTLVFSTLLGGKTVNMGGGQFISGLDEVRDLAVDVDDTIVVAGVTQSPLFPVTPGAFQPDSASQPGTDGFVARLDATGKTLLAATYLGGGPIGFSGGTDQIRGLAFADDETILLAGWTESPDFPVTAGAWATRHGSPGLPDGFVARLSPDLGTLVASTFLGGSGTDQAWDVATAPGGEVVVAGLTGGPGFPTTPGSYDPIGAGGDDAFVTRFDADLGAIVASTFFGGAAAEFGPLAVAVDSAGAITLAGRTWSHSLPVTPGAFQTTKGGATTNEDLFVARFHPDGHMLVYGTYLGGSLDETQPWIDLCVTPSGDAYLGGGTLSPDYPTTPGVLKPNNPNADGVLTRLVPLADGVDRFGTPTAPPGLPVAIGALAMPAPGQDGFGLTCTGAPPAATGLLLLSLGGLSSPASAGGAALWISPARLLALAPVMSDGLGFSQQRLPLPDDPALVGTVGFTQYAWPLAAPGGFATSAALRIEVLD